MRVAALADVHGNAPALAAVLAEVEGEEPDLIVFCGDLTWGSLPQETLALVRALRIPARFVRGNADRLVGTDTESLRGPWMASHAHARRPRIPRGFEPTVSVDVDRLGPTCFCHGSPRSDEECVTERTPAERVREFMAGREEQLVVTAHVHVQYDRTVEGVRFVGPGSVGLPYDDRGLRQVGASRAGRRASPHRLRRRSGRRAHACHRRPARGGDRRSHAPTSGAGRRDRGRGRACLRRLSAQGREGMPRTRAYSLA